MDHPSPSPTTTASHRRLLGLVMVAYLLAGLALRVALLTTVGWPGIATAFAALGLGLVADALMAVVLTTPLALILGWSGGGSLRHGWWRFAVLGALMAALLFGAAVEWFFFDEFNARFNHIAVDYLLFPGEVATNVWQSYNVPLYLALAVGIGALAAWPIHAALRGCAFAAPTWRQRLVNGATTVAMAVAALVGLMCLPTQPFANRALDEIAANGVVQLSRAFATAHLSFEDYYRTLPAGEAERRTAAEVGWPKPDEPARQFTAAMRRERPLDVVVVLEESLGSEFVGRLGGRTPCTPNLDRWSHEGLLLTNLMATGNRTVRGLEGVLNSFPPLPGDSVWKREKSQNVASIARVLRAQGYQTEFLYGGAGTFDGMKSFATANGWERFVEDGLLSSDFPKDAYRTAWGVADGYVFDALLDHHQQAHAAGKPFFATLMSTSNHKPFLTPDTKNPRRSTAKMVKWGVIGAILLAAVIAMWWIGGRRYGRVRLCLFGLIVLIGYGVWLNYKLQPKDSRQNATRYADRALGAYLDRAKAAGLLDHTVVLVVGDHGARVYGAEAIPAASYRIPALFLAPESRWRGATHEGLCSQVDLAPTLLSLAGVDYRAPFFGQDLLSVGPDQPGRAWLIHNRGIGLLTDDALVVLGLQRTTMAYRRPNRASDAFAPVSMDADPALQDLADRASAIFQAASHLYEGRRYVLPDGK